MVVLTRRQVASLLHDRRQAMAETRFRPENFHEIQRVLGVRFAPDLQLVVSTQRAHAANTYLKRLQRDVQRSQAGYYRHVHAMPLQIRRMKIHTEDQRCFKSVLVPKLKLPPLQESADPTPRTQPSVTPKLASPKIVSPKLESHKLESPKIAKSLSPGSVSPSGSGHQVVEEGSAYVAHKSFSPHTNTHVHVLFKQMPGSVTPRKARSVASTSSGAVSTVGKSPRSSFLPHITAKLPPSDDSTTTATRSVDDNESSVSTWTVETPPQPYSFLNSQAPVRRQLFVNLMPQLERAAKESPTHKDDHPIKPQVSLPAILPIFSKKTKNGIPTKVADALAAGGNPTASVYKFVLPSKLPASHSSEPVERPKPSVMGSRLRFSLPAISTKAGLGSKLAVDSVSRANIIHAVA